MGVKVRKALGYGLVDVEHVGSEITDPRLSAGNVVRAFDEFPSVHEYGRYLRERTKKEDDDLFALLDHWATARRDPSSLSRTMDDCVTYEAEHGSSVLLLQPLGVGSSWMRFDDTMDWIEETYLREPSQADRVEVLQHGIHPFSGSYMRSDTGEKLPSDVMTWIRARSALQGGHELRTSDLDGMSVELGFADYAEADRLIAPVVPDEIRAVADFLGLFTDDAVWRQLRPLFYVWWA